jgi:SAM-dependent methyltransferase
VADLTLSFYLMLFMIGYSMRSFLNGFLKEKVHVNRTVCGGVVVCAAVLLLLIAIFLEKFGLRFGHIRPIAFIGTAVAVKLGLFSLWPSLARLRSSSTAFVTKDLFVLKDNGASVDQGPGRQNPLTLWHENSSRLASALFATNLPTFILSSDQRLLDWNSAFDLVFGRQDKIKRGAPVRVWYELLDNFRRVPARVTKLYGDGILPLADRERAVYVSSEYGRMVFTKVMAPLIDLASGRIVGWSVVLNVNSVHQRQKFFTDLYAAIAAETRRIRYASAYDRLFDQFSGRRQLIELHVKELTKVERVLDVGCGTGAFSASLLAEGHRVTAVDGDPHVLRQARQRCASFRRVKIVRKPLADLSSLPQQRYGAVVLCYHLQTEAEPQVLVQRLHASLAPGGLLLLTLRADGSTMDSLFAAVGEQLRDIQAFDELKHQLEQVRSESLAAEVERQTQAKLDVATACSLLLANGFTLIREHLGLEDGQSLLLTFRKA